MTELNDFQKWCKEILPVVQAGANGEPVEYCPESESEWYLKDTINLFACVEYRVKQKTILVNGFEIPEPIREETGGSFRYFVPLINSPELFYQGYWDRDEDDYHMLEYGLLHHTKEAAIAHAKALLGIIK